MNRISETEENPLS